MARLKSRPITGSFAKPAEDSWERRLRLALRLGNGAVFSARQCEQLAAALGWKRDDPPTTPAA